MIEKCFSVSVLIFLGLNFCLFVSFFLFFGDVTVGRWEAWVGVGGACGFGLDLSV